MPRAQIPSELVENEALRDAIAVLPRNYNFEVTLSDAMPFLSYNRRDVTDTQNGVAPATGSSKESCPAVSRGTPDVFMRHSRHLEAFYSTGALFCDG